MGGRRRVAEPHLELAADHVDGHGRPVVHRHLQAVLQVVEHGVDDGHHPAGHLPGGDDRQEGEEVADVAGVHVDDRVATLEADHPPAPLAAADHAVAEVQAGALTQGAILAGLKRHLVHYPTGP